MILNKLGNTDVKVSAIGLGTWAIGGGGDEDFGWGPQDDKESIATIRRAVDLGINWIDTAPIYGKGHSEKVVGRAIKEIRDKIMISTKFGFRWDENKNVYFNLKKESVRYEIEESLKRLQTDVIDLYMIHMPIPENEIEEAWNELGLLKKEGKIRYSGASTFSLEQLKRIHPIHPVTFILAHYNMLDPSIEGGLLDYCGTNNISVFVYCSMYRGLLTGKMTRERIEKLPADDHRRKDINFIDPYLNDNLNLVKRIRPIAERNDKTPAQLSIAWTLRRPEVTAAIVGARNPSQIEQTVPAGNWILSKEDKTELDKILGEHYRLLGEIKTHDEARLKKHFHFKKGELVSPEFDVDYAIDIRGNVGDEGLKLSIGYDKHEYDRGTIEKFSELYRSNLVKIIDHCVDMKKEISDLDMSPLEYHVKKEYDKYRQQVSEEKWPDITTKNEYRNLLLTGATGYLGAYLVYELLVQTTAVLYLPVRGKTLNAADERLKQKLSFYFGDDVIDTFQERLVVVNADLRMEQLGLNANRYKELVETIDAVVHSAANVKHYGSYEELYKDNVETTTALLNFASTGKKKHFHFISTVDTGAGHIPGLEYMLYSEYCHDMGQKSDNVYIRSKFEAEKQVLAYRDKGLNTSIYRAGNMTFHSGTGHFQENIEDNYFYSMLKALIKVGFWSSNMMKMEFDLSYVNDAAKSIVLLMTKKNLRNQIYHIYNPEILTWEKMVGLLKDAKIEIVDLEPEKIKSKLVEFEGNSKYEKIVERVKIYSWEWEDNDTTKTIKKADRTVSLLEKLGFRWPVTNKNHIEKMIAHCKDVGFL